MTSNFWPKSVKDILTNSKESKSYIPPSKKYSGKPNFRFKVKKSLCFPATVFSFALHQFFRTLPVNVLAGTVHARA